MKTRKPTVLLVEDDLKTVRALRAGLETDGYEVVAARTGDEGASLFGAGDFEAVVLDWMLPGRTGLEILQSFRARGVRTPVLLLTAKDAIEDRVLGLDSGADDYLVKPFALAELLARLRVLIRRADDRDPAQKRIADLQIDPTSRLAKRGERRLLLTPREFDLLAYLARHAGQTVSRRMLARDVWHEVQRVTPLDNVIDVHIAHLRRKLDDGHATKLLHTVRGIGFMLREEPPGA